MLGLCSSYKILGFCSDSAYADLTHKSKHLNAFNSIKQESNTVSNERETDFLVDVDGKSAFLYEM